MPELALDDPVTRLAGVGTRRAEALLRLGIRTLYELAHHFPRRYEERLVLSSFKALKVGEPAALRAQVVTTKRRKLGRRRQQVVVAEFADRGDTGRLSVTFFNPYIDTILQPGSWVLLTGIADFYRTLTIANPQVEPLRGPDSQVDPFLPIYASTEGIDQRFLSGLIRQAVPQLAPALAHTDLMPVNVAEAQGLMPYAEALAAIHRPPSLEAAARAADRLRFQECFLLEAALASKRERERTPGTARQLFSVPAAVHARILKRLPFTPTADQARAIEEIRADLERPGRMRRLLQGDVGCGKTAVALYPLLAAVAAGFQGALLAPTEILAEQHARTLGDYLSGSRVRVAKLTGALTTAERRAGRAGLADGSVQLVVGTHALLEPEVEFARLGAIVIDEQHKFGVLQREALVEKGASERPHLLVMTATPIPRTLSLTLFGELDVSVLRERPPGRAQITTRFVPKAKQEAALEFLEEQLGRGARAYVIEPAVEDNPGSDLRSVAEMAGRLRERLPSVTIATIHGQLDAAKKQEALAAFASGAAPVLVASTVVEVGVDMPQATLMIIDQVERFGLAQLHQLRGRIGRGSRPGTCLLFGDPKSPEARERVRTLVATTDGFAIAEIDLKLRGAGEFFSTRQHGMPRLRLTRLEDPAHANVLVSARDAAFAAVEAGRLDRARLEKAIGLHFGADFALTTVG